MEKADKRKIVLIGTGMVGMRENIQIAAMQILLC